MKSINWDSILKEYEKLPNSLQEKNRGRIKGFEHVFNLIPLLKKSKVLNSGIRTLSHYSIVFTLPDKKENVLITPPSLIFTGSNNEFSIIIINAKTSEQIRSQNIHFMNLVEVIEVAENYFLRLK